MPADRLRELRKLAATETKLSADLYAAESKAVAARESGGWMTKDELDALVTARDAHRLAVRARKLIEEFISNKGSL
jgi:hypothetical protein